MQGTLDEVDLRSLLQLLEVGQQTGVLLIEKDNIYSQLNNNAWFIFIVNGKITYATDRTNTNLLRLRDYLYPYKVQDKLEELKVENPEANNLSEYDYICFLWQKQIITVEQGHSIIQRMVEEALFDILSLHQGIFIFRKNQPFFSQLGFFESSYLVRKMMRQLIQWKEFYPYIQQPDQCPVIFDESSLRTVLSANTYNSFKAKTNGKTTLRQLSRYFNYDLATIAQAIYPYVKKGWIKLNQNTLHSRLETASALNDLEDIKKPQVVFISNEAKKAKLLEGILEHHNYKLITFSEPTSAMILLFQIKPDLIVYDLTLSDPDGYEICLMLRNCKIFQKTPIILLSPHFVFLDEVKAKMVNATAYLTFPVSQKDILNLLEKHIYLKNPLFLSNKEHICWDD